MLSLFQRKKIVDPPSKETPPAAPSKGMIRPESAASLLATPRRQKLLEHIWQRTSLSRKQFNWLYAAPLERYAALVQNFPASESHHHAYHGGMLDHGIEIVAYALKLRQSHLLPAGAPPEDQAAQSEAWTAATAYAALLHDIGKVAVDLQVELDDGSVWHPWHGPLRRAYRFRYRDDREYRLHSAATGLLYHQLLDRRILDWLSGYPDMWASLLYVLAGQYEHAGTLGELVISADRASVAQELGGDPSRAMAAPKHALQRKLLDGLRYLIKEELKLNQAEASDGWLTQDALWLVSKTVSDKLRAHLLSQGVDGIPANNTAVFNVLQEHGILQATSDGKAIWRASVTSGNGWSHSFTLLQLSPALIWGNNERPEPYAGTVVLEAEPLAAAAPDDASRPDQHSTDPTVASDFISPGSTAFPHSRRDDEGTADAMEDLLSLISKPPSTEADSQDGSAAEAPPEQKQPPVQSGTVALAQNLIAERTLTVSAEHFLSWLKLAVQSRKLVINDAKALVHTVDDTVFLVSPGVFQRYAQEHPQIAALAKQENIQEWQWVQKRFEKLQQHRKQLDGLNIWTCEVIGPRKSRRLHGYLLLTPSVLFEQAPVNNPYLRLSPPGQACPVWTLPTGS